ncbi:hypothetical protein MKZ38_008648 [Zalerion maritima]|uniref:Uncharacterized protein n=1 Tax=Zalerion maritima TaxID=339359 RepID=A0AAD5S0N2_9PEZI|nr:hypothetical protein MKZ38_008648 [Zalerion maritima]
MFPHLQQQRPLRVITSASGEPRLLVWILVHKYGHLEQRPIIFSDLAASCFPAAAGSLKESAKVIVLSQERNEGPTGSTCPVAIPYRPAVLGAAYKRTLGNSRSAWAKATHAVGVLLHLSSDPFMQAPCCYWTKNAAYG